MIFVISISNLFQNENGNTKTAIQMLCGKLFLKILVDSLWDIQKTVFYYLKTLPIY